MRCNTKEVDYPKEPVDKKAPVDKKEYDDKKKHDKEWVCGIFDSNVVGFAVAIANVTDADFCNAQANAAVLVAGDDINARFENDTQVQDD